MEYNTPTVITATELKKNLGKYLDIACDNNEVIITKNGKKAIRLSPYITEIEKYFTIQEKALDYQYGGKKVSYEEFMEIYENSTCEWNSSMVKYSSWRRQTLFTRRYP